ncbi:MAG: MerR family transcriptional regulator [Thermoleophilia bacterium]|nr:MerR family transcriptional regulator [Thermoleophilia bacterium]
MADDRPVYMIGIAAELAGMHPQTLRVYERRGLVTPRRSPRGTRLYSEADLELLLRIQELSEEGFNLTGVERVLSMERALLAAKRRIERLEREVQETKQAAREEIARVERSKRADLVVVSSETAVVPYRPKDPRQTRGGN